MSLLSWASLLRRTITQVQGPFSAALRQFKDQLSRSQHTSKSSIRLTQRGWLWRPSPTKRPSARCNFTTRKQAQQPAGLYPQRYITDILSTVEWAWLAEAPVAPRTAPLTSASRHLGKTRWLRSRAVQKSTLCTCASKPRHILILKQWRLQTSCHRQH